MEEFRVVISYICKRIEIACQGWKQLKCYLIELLHNIFPSNLIAYTGSYSFSSKSILSLENLTIRLASLFHCLPLDRSSRLLIYLSQNSPLKSLMTVTMIILNLYFPRLNFYSLIHSSFVCIKYFHHPGHSLQYALIRV